MPFPTTAIIDAFTRANETPLASPWLPDPPNQSWPNPNLVSNQAQGAAASNYTSSYHSTSTFARPCEVYATLGTVTGAEWRVGFIQSPDSASASGYMLAIRGDNAQKIFRITNAGFTEIASVVQAVAFGSVCGMSLSASGDILAYDDGVSFLSVTDTTHTGPFYLWFALFGTSQTVDDFGGGAASAAVTPTMRVTRSNLRW